MKRRGFTLIELLGVIIVLGILAVITVPIVMNTIEKSKKNSAIRSAEQIIRAATLDYTTNDNFTTEQKDILPFDYNGQKPESGYIQFDKNEKVRFYMIKDGYCVIKKYDSELIAIKLDDVDVCDWNYGTNLVNLEANNQFIYADNLAKSNLLDYKIYGNTVQNKYVEVVDLPEEYQQVDYVEGNGKQYIDTGIKPTNTTKAEVTFELTESGLTASQYILGSRATSSSSIIFGFSGSSSNYRFTGVLLGDSNYPAYSRRSKTVYKNTVEVEYTEGSGYRAKFTYNDLTNDVNVENGAVKDHVIVYSPYKIDGLTGDNPNIYLFALNKSNIHKGLKVYNTKIYNNGELVRHFIPCYRKSDNIAGLYDMIEGNFYPSVGTSNFIKGNDIENVKYDFLGSYDDETNKYKIQVKVNGKNLFNKAGYLTLEDYNISVTYMSKKIPLSPNEIYKISVKKYNDFSDVKGYLLISNNQRVSVSFTAIFSNTASIGDSIVNSKYTTNKSGNLYIGRYELEQEELDTIWDNVDVQIERGETATSYEDYKEQIFDIYLDEPLRCLGDVCDYIDYENQQVVRKIGFSEGDLIELTSPKIEKKDLPQIETYEGINNISVISGDVMASKIQIAATKK